MTLKNHVEATNDIERTALQFFDDMGPDLDTFRKNYQDLLADDVVWESVGLEPRVGKQACLDYLEVLGQRGMAYCEVNIISMASRDNLVLSERVDTMYRGDGTVMMPCRIMGVLQIENGKIVRYTDYMDMYDIKSVYAAADAQNG